MVIEEKIKHGVISGIISIGTSSILRMVLGFVTVTIITRVISQEHLGVYFLLFTILSFFQMIGDFGLRLSAAKFVASAIDDHERQSIVNNLLTIRLFSILLITILSFLFKPLILSLYPSPLLPSLYVYVPSLFAAQITEDTLSFIMQGFQMYRKMAVAQAVAGVLNCFLSLLLVLVFKLDIEGYVLGTLISVSITAVLRLWMIPTSKAFAIDFPLMRKIIRFGLPLQGNDIMSFVFTKLDVLLLGVVGGPAQVAYLEVAGKIPNYFRQIYSSLESVYFPHMSSLFGQGRQNEAERTMNNFVRLASFMTLFCALVFILFSHEIITLVFSSKYLEGESALGLLMVAVGIGLVSTILDTALISAGFPSYLLIINLVTMMVSVVGNIYMIPIFGFMGAVYAKLLSNVLANPVSAICLHREKIDVRQWEYVKPALFLIICVAIPKYFHWEGFFLLSLPLVLFIVLSFVFRVITKNDILTILRIIVSPKHKIVSEG